MDPAGAVLAAATLEEMRWPVTTTDETLWAAGFGLGLILVPQADRVVHVGHDGAMPGFLAGAYGRRGGDGTPAALGCAVLGSSGTAGGRSTSWCTSCCGWPSTDDPADITPWAPGRARAGAYRVGAGPLVERGLRVRLLLARRRAAGPRVADAPADRPPAVFAAAATDAAGRAAHRAPGGRRASCCG